MEEILRKNPRLWMVAIYLFCVALFLYIKPALAFDENGSVRPFGISAGSTVFPVWWWMFIFAVVSYLSVVYMLNHSL
uniref:Uncharacterized protein n=1 Tax=viral metagenome TaxID=1070528 RepID=A0A6C0K1B1_9ZZZZ